MISHQGAISAGHDKTLEVAKLILKEGGNAFDAAIAAFLTMFIAEPCMASAGGNGFALLKPADGKVRFLDFFCQTPLNKNLKNPDFYPIEVDFGTEQEIFHIGLASAAVPGTIAAIFDIHEKYGSIPFKHLKTPAQKLAKEGVILNPFQAYDLSLLAPIFAEDSSVKNTFFKDDKIKKEGDLIALPLMADFLDFLSDEKARGFYFGEIAQKIAEDCKIRGGNLSRSDFENYKLNCSDPLLFNWNNKKIYFPNGPSKGGIAGSIFLNLAQSDAFGMADAVKSAQNMLANEMTLIQQYNHVFPNNNLKLSLGYNSNKGTSHFNIVDKNNNAIALTSSLGEGCGYFIPGTHMQLNNMLGELFLLPNGAHSWLPNTRLNSMMTPTIVCNEHDQLEMVLGSGGASRIPYAIGQVIYQVYKNNVSLEAATEKPRFHFQNGKYQVEGPQDWNGPEDEAILWDKQSLYFGGVHSIQIKTNSIYAKGDSRRIGAAEVL